MPRKDTPSHRIRIPVIDIALKISLQAIRSNCPDRLTKTNLKVAREERNQTTPSQKDPVL